MFGSGKEADEDDTRCSRKGAVISISITVALFLVFSGINKTREN